MKSIQVDDILEKWELEDEIKNLQSKWNSIESLHLKIDNILVLHGVDSSYEEEFITLELLYKNIKRSINMKIPSVSNLNKATPQLEILIFTGKYDQWPTFYDLFNEAIHQNNSVTKAQKMQHLKAKVKGEA